MSRTVADAFDTKLRQLPKNFTHADVLRLYPLPSSPSPSPAHTTPLEEVRFYDDFTTPPDVINARSYAACDAAAAAHGTAHVVKILQSDKHHELKKYRSFDFRLTDEETQRVQQHGFVVSQRLSSDSFGSMFYRLYTNDAPVFVSSDAVLHAWHHSFDAFLMHLETEELLPLLEKILDKAITTCEGQYDAAVDSGSQDRQDICAQVELYLAVAHGLLNGDGGSGHETRPLRVAHNANSLSKLLELVLQEELGEVDLFGARRDVDFSLFKPRGHYTKSADLQRFFRAISWLGTIDFRTDGAPDTDEEAKANQRYQLQCACMLVNVLHKAGVMDMVKLFYETISAIAGDGVGADSMTPIQLHELLADRDILGTYFGPHSKSQLTSLQDEIGNRGLGAQAIRGHPMKATDPFSGSPTLPPTSFAFLGQQFVWSAFIFSKLVFDEVVDAETGAKVVRRMVSGVDAAFALFGNNVAGDLIAKRMSRENDNEGDEEHVAFRDGLPYARNLIAARRVVDEAMDKASEDPMSCSLALLWQLALRELSRPSAHGGDVFKSDTWQKRVMNTQIASFAQLRHDTLLYAKQACTGYAECEFPAGFVDPYPSFWTHMQRLAERTLAIVSKLELAFASDPNHGYSYVFDRAGCCFGNFVNAAQSLEGIAVAQSKNEALSDQQTLFLKNIIEIEEGSGDPFYSGWYPSLFFSDGEDSCKPDYLVADIHTDAPSPLHGDPGGILHLGVGEVNMGYAVVDNVMYAGPVFSHYEFVTPINKRLTDDEFSARMDEFEPPKWATRSFLAPLDPEFRHRLIQEDKVRLGNTDAPGRWIMTMFDCDY